MSKKVLVIGATGLIGQAVAHQLKADGFFVRVFSRSHEKAASIFDSGYEVAEGNVLDPDALPVPFKGMECLYISLPERDVPAALPNIVKIAKQEGIKHITYASGCTVKEENSWHPMIKGHFIGEKILSECGIPYTIFALTMVMDMIPRYANNGKPFIMGTQPHGWSWIYSGDLARMVSKAYTIEEAKNKRFTVFGPEKLTIPEAVDRFNSIFFPEAKPARPTPYWVMNLLALFIGNKLRYPISIFKYFEDHPEEGNPEETNKLLGKPETGLKEFFEIYRTLNEQK